MRLDRAIAFIFLVLCCVYGYAAFFTMDANLPPFMRFNPVWPSTFPKALSILGALAALFVLLGLEKDDDGKPDIDVKSLERAHILQAVLLLAAMAAYALALRPVGFIGSTSLFLIGGAALLGERRWLILVPVCLAMTFGIWWLVDSVLGIFLRPLPYFLGT